MKLSGPMMNNCLAIVAGICITFSQPVIAEPTIEQKVDQAIVLMKKAVAEAEKGNYVLGSPYARCPGYEDQPPPDFTRETYCNIPAFACRCF